MDGEHDGASELAELAALSDPIAQVKRANELVARYQEVVGEVSRLRREALGELASRGFSQVELARMLGMTRTRVQQLLTTGPKAERALLGIGSLTIAGAGKAEAGRMNPSVMVSTEIHGAYRLLSDAARGYGLASEFEAVPPPGLVRLNRENLIVLGSPRVLPIVSQTLEADGNLGFDSGAQGWFLRDYVEGTMFRSPSDLGDPGDHAYVGRLPRPDGRGTFLYMAGIHAMGTLGVAQYVTENIEEIYSTVKTRQWSTIVQCRYDSDTRAIEAVERVAPIYTSGQSI